MPNRNFTNVCPQHGEYFTTEAPDTNRENCPACEDGPEPITEVMFRREGRDVLAVFPYEINDHHGRVLCYAHLGQHGGADYGYITDKTFPASPAEYADLKTELESIGYNLKVITRRNHARYIQAYQEARK